MKLNITEFIIQIGLLFVIVFVLALLCRKGVKALMSPEARMARIKQVSGWIQLITGFCLIMGLYGLLVFIFGWPTVVGKAGVLVSGSFYKSPAEMPGTVLGLWSIQVTLVYICGGVILYLFQLYKKGILFSAKHTRCFVFFATYTLLNWIIDFQMPSSSHNGNGTSLTPIFLALMLLFLSWVMDEARKMREEQDLTV